MTLAESVQRIAKVDEIARALSAALPQLSNAGSRYAAPQIVAITLRTSRSLSPSGRAAPTSARLRCHGRDHELVSDQVAADGAGRDEVHATKCLRGSRKAALSEHPDCHSAGDRGAAVALVGCPLRTMRIISGAPGLGTAATAKQVWVLEGRRDALFARSVHLAGWSTSAAVTAV